VRARARVAAERDGRGGSRLVTLRSEAPLLLRSTPEALYLVGGAGGPLGGDDVSLEIVVGSGARLTVRTAAASIALPGAGPSRFRVWARVAEGGELRWLPEPLVAATACDHHMEATVALEGDARLVWREELVLGRHSEPSGSVSSRSDVDLDATPLLRHELALGPAHPGAASPAVTAGARAVGSVVMIGPGWAPSAPAVLRATAAVLALARSGLQVVALADDASVLRSSLDAGMLAAAGPGI